MNDLSKQFSNGEFQLSIEPHPVDGFRVQAPGLAKALSVTDAYTLLRSIPEEEKGAALVRTLGGTQHVSYVTEAGFYRAIGQRQTGRIQDPATRAMVERFQNWVYREVLPSIRATGGYSATAALPGTYAEALRELASSVEAKVALEAKVAADAPKVLFADSVATSETTILVGDLAKILRGNGVMIGANRLFAQLREDGLLIRRQGTDWNMPTQRAMELGLFKVKETAVTYSDGHVTVSKTPKVTGKGQAYLINRYTPTRKELSA